MKTQPSPWNRRHKVILAALLIGQFAIAAIVGGGELLADTMIGVIPAVAITAAIPVALFLAAYGLSVGFRDFVLSQDLRTLTLLQQWRVVGFAFLLLYGVEALPGLFAWPAGLGDVAIGLAAVAVVLRLERDPAYSVSAGYIGFHLLGLLDFAVAIVTAGLTSGALPDLVSDGLTSAAMDVWPLNLFPSFIVPAFIILHLTALLKIAALRRATEGEAIGDLRPA